MKRRASGLTAFVAAQLSSYAPAFAHWGDGDFYMHNMGFGGGFFGLLTTLLGLALIVVVVVWAVRWLGGEAASTRGRSRALDILDERFAKGEISQQQYDEMRRALSK